MATRVTIQDIADSLGLSRNTVSKAINNTGSLAPSTREAIFKKAQEMGYKLFSYASEDSSLSFNVQRVKDEKISGDFALLTAGILDSLHFSAKMLDVMQEEASKLGCGFTIYRVTQRELKEKKLPASFDKSRILGIFCVEMFDEGNWNWETMFNMCKDFADPENDKYALDAWYYENALTESTGVPLIGMKDGNIVNNINDPKIAKVQEMMYDLQKNNVVYPKHEHEWNVRGGKDKWGTGLASGLTLFYPIGFWAIEDALSVTAPFGDISKGEVMFAPVPCDKDSDAQYVPSRVHGFCIVKNAKNPEGVAAWLDCTRYAEADPKAKEVTITQLKEDYGWTDEMIEMRDRIYQMAAEHPVFEFAQGVSTDISGVTDNIIKATMHPSDPKSWTQVVQENEKKLDYLINEAQEKVAAQ